LLRKPEGCQRFNILSLALYLLQIVATIEFQVKNVFHLSISLAS